MDFESLQAIWDTQNDAPVFSMNDARLPVALYQQREHSRRRLFKEQFAPLYVVAPFMLAALGLVFVAFFVKSRYIEKIGRDFPMATGDYIAFAVGAASLLSALLTMHAELKKHERTQNVFAPSLREELARGIAQLDFELSLQENPRALRLVAIILIGSLVFVWEVGRLNGNPTPWGLALTTAFSFFVALWVGFAAKRKMVQRVAARRRALEAMRASLEERKEVHV
jgi:hypothetical protein